MHTRGVVGTVELRLWYLYVSLRCNDENFVVVIGLLEVYMGWFVTKLLQYLGIDSVGCVIGRVGGYVYMFGICVSLRVWFICRCEKFDVLTVDVNASLDCRVEFFIAPKFFVISVLSVVATVFKVEFSMVLWSARVHGSREIGFNKKWQTHRNFCVSVFLVIVEVEFSRFLNRFTWPFLSYLIFQFPMLICI